MAKKNAPFYKNSDFKKLKKEWDGKLKKSGFRDIEYQINGEPADFMVGPNPMDILLRWGPDKQRFYELARQLYWTLVEEGAPSRTCAIWRMYSDGQSIQAIVASGLGRGFKKPTRWEVSKVVRECKSRLLRESRDGQGLASTEDMVALDLPESSEDFLE